MQPGPELCFLSYPCAPHFKLSLEEEPSLPGADPGFLLGGGAPQTNGVTD